MKMLKIKETKDFRVTELDQPVHIGLDRISSFDPIIVPDLMKRTAENHPHHTALMYMDKVQNEWKGITYKEYRKRVERVAKGFIKLGLEKRGVVAVLAHNSVEWFISEMAAIHAGGIIVGIYTTNSVDACQHILESSKANIVVVDDVIQMEKIHKLKDKLPHLKAVIQTNSQSVENEDGFWRWNEIEELDVTDVEEEYQKRISDIFANECCCLIYTSGTVGLPKAVMLSHDNLTYDAHILNASLNNFHMETFVSYLPMSHIAAQIFDNFLPLTNAGTVYFADRDALKGTLVKTLVEAQPTLFLGVPRVFEKMQEQMKTQSGVNKQTLGFSCIQYLLTGAAPMSVETKKHFLSFDMKIFECYGLSESTGPQTLSTDLSQPFDTIGKTLAGTMTKIENLDDQGHGEICMKGRNIFMGYLHDLEKTKEAIDDEGWFHTGDIGFIDDQGYVYITGRLKELIITAGGENIPPVHIENLVKAECSAISNAFLVGEKKKYLTILVSLKTEMDRDGAPMDNLAPETSKWLQGMNLSYTNLSEILNAGPDAKVMQALTDVINKVNKKSVSNAQKIQKFAILPHDFSISTGELGPTMKLKRNVVVNKYSDLIENLYK